MRLVQEIGEWIYSLVISFAIALFINIFIFQPSLVLGQSMAPTLHDNQRIFLSKISHTFGKVPDYGDIVTIDSRVSRERSWRDDVADPLANWVTVLTGKQPSHETWVKRVIGKPGDVLEFKDGKVYRNGAVLQETYIKEPMEYTSNKPVEVPSGHIFVLGDNRNNSSDSRIIGSVPYDHVLGVMLFGI